jgi:hypothetical protein
MLIMINEWKRPFKYRNGKFPGFIGLTRDQYIAVVTGNLQLAINLGISYNDYMSLRYKNFPKN